MKSTKIVTALTIVASIPSLVAAYPQEIYIKNTSDAAQIFIIKINNSQQVLVKSLQPDYFEIFDNADSNTYTRIEVADKQSFDFQKDDSGSAYLIYSNTGFKRLTAQEWNATFD